MRKLDNVAKIFSLEEDSNIFRLSINLKENVDKNILKKSIYKTLEKYPFFKVKIEKGFFWYHLEYNNKNIIIEKTSKSSFKNNNNYLFKITYQNNIINIDIYHVLTDGLGSLIFLKSLLYNYFNIKYNLSNKDTYINYIYDEYIKNYDKSIKYKPKYQSSFKIEDKYNIRNNKTIHYMLNLNKFKIICKKYNVSITEYITALYIYSIYKTIYNKKSNKDIIITIPIDLRRHYNVSSLNNFFTCMDINSNIVNSDITFEKILKQVKLEFNNNLTKDNINKYLSHDVKLGTNYFINLIPLILKKRLIKYVTKLFTKTATLSNLGPIILDEQYRKYIDNIIVLVKTTKCQKIKCTISSYENNLNIILNSNLISNEIENEFYNMLKQTIDVKLINSVYNI